MELRAVVRCIKHPSYSADEHSSGDIALVQLASPIAFNDYMLPVCLPKPGDPLDPGTMCWVTGWGHIDRNKREDVWSWWQGREGMGGPVPTLSRTHTASMQRMSTTECALKRCHSSASPAGCCQLPDVLLASKKPEDSVTSSSGLRDAGPACITTCLTSSLQRAVVLTRRSFLTGQPSLSDGVLVEC